MKIIIGDYNNTCKIVISSQHALAVLLVLVDMKTVNYLNLKLNRVMLKIEHGL